MSFERYKYRKNLADRLISMSVIMKDIKMKYGMDYNYTKVVEYVKSIKFPGENTVICCNKIHFELKLVDRYKPPLSSLIF